MQRSIRFSKFRNLGFDKDDYLILNGDFQKGKVGNLVILIGPNNAGKSNVLEGIIKACSDVSLCERDITDLSFEEKDRTPSLALVYRDDKSTIELVREYNKNSSWRVVSGDMPSIKPSNTDIKKDILMMRSIAKKYGYLLPSLDKLANEIDNKTINSDALYDRAISVLNEYQSNARYHSGYKNFLDILKNSDVQLVIHYAALNGGKSDFVKSYIKKECGIDNVCPKCLVYKERPINNNDLHVSRVENLNSQSFFVSLFKTIKFDVKTIENTYNQYRNTGNIQYLKKLEKDLQKKVDKISNKFNELYFVSNDQYKFSIVLESNQISFGMARGKDEEPINLEYQSTGFRWFFNLFFNFLSNNELTSGDIVIMDEPATNLHVQGQRELREFIKEFAISNDILFVLATHSPFLINVDHYDELRVISMENNRSRIDNRFTVINLDDPDSLLPIKDALTIKQNVLYDLDTEVYFVEGITDYNYLTMFKKLLKIKDIAFLPFNGVGNNSAKTHKILEALLSVKFHKRSLLVDADKAGLDMFNQAKDADFLSVHNMSEVKIGENKNAMMVEDLFSAEDKKKFSAIIGKKSDGTSSMKDHCKLSDFSKTTVDNFKQLFKLLED